MGCRQTALRNISAYLQVKMRISLKYMIEGMLKIRSREETNETGGVLADMFSFVYVTVTCEFSWLCSRIMVFCNMMLHCWVGVPQCFKRRYFLDLQGSSGPWVRSWYTSPFLHLTCNHFHWATDWSDLACISLPPTDIFMNHSTLKMNPLM